MPERYCRLFDILPGQHIHLGRNLPDRWKRQLDKFHVSTGTETSPCDLLIEPDISKSLNLIKKGELDKLINRNGSALLQVSKSPRQVFKRIKSLLTRHIDQLNKRTISISLPENSSAVKYFALSIKLCLETPDDINLLPCTTENGKLCITRQSTDFSGSIAILATTRENPFSRQLFELPDNSLAIPSDAIIRIIFRERGTVIVEFSDAEDNRYIARTSLSDSNKKNIVKNYKVITGLYANPALSLNAKKLIPAPVSSSEKSSIETKKQGQLAWKVVRDNPELESTLLNQAWDFSFSLIAGTCSKLKLDPEGFDTVVGNDLKYIQYYCSNDDEILETLTFIDKYLRDQLFGKEVTVASSHGDYGYGNILCDEDSGNLSGVFDWDTSRNVELPGVDFFNLLIQKFRTHNRMDESYTSALCWLESDEPLPRKIRSQLYEKFGISGEVLKPYTIISVLHLMGRDFQFHKAGSLRPEERDTIILLAPSIK